MGSTHRKDFLATIVSVLHQITPYLSTYHLTRLLLVGESRLTAALMRPGVVTNLSIFVSMYPLQDYFTKTPYLQWVLRFPTLTRLEINTQYKRSIGGNFRLSKLPKTLTSLTLKHMYGFSYFLEDRILNPYLMIESTEGSYAGLNSASQRIVQIRQHSSPFVDLATLFPYLTHLNAPSAPIEYNNFLFWLKSLPPWLSLLDTDALVPGYAHSQSMYADLKPAFALLPPELHTLISKGHQSWQIILPETLPPSLTHLEVGGCSSAQPFIASRSLKVLEVESLELSHAQYENCFPPNLTRLGFTGTTYKHQTKTWDTEALFKNLPRQLLSLTIPYANKIDAFPDLPKGLTSLTVKGISFMEFKVIDLLPKGLTHWSWHTRHTLTRDFAARLPRSLRTLELLSATIQDDCFASFPELLYEVRCPKWELTGYTLDKNAKIASLDSLRASFAQYPRIHHQSVSKVYSRGIRYCPPSVTSIIDLDAKALKISDLSHLCVTLPASLPFIDSPKHLSVLELPQTLTALHIEGAARLSTWKALPPTVFLVRGGTVFMESKDVVEALDGIKKSWSIAGEAGANPSESSALHVPNSLAEHLLKMEDPQRSIIFPYTSSWLAQWEKEHFALLPDSITDLTIAMPLPEFPTFLLDKGTKSSSENVDNQDESNSISHRPLPLALKRLELSKSSYSLRKPASQNSMQKDMEYGSIFTLCKLSPLELPLTLTELSLFGNISMEEISQFPMLNRLKILHIGRVGRTAYHEQKLDDTSFVKLCSILPPSLETLHLLKTTFNTELVHHLPHSLLELHIRLPMSYNVNACSSFPPNLKTLHISCIDLNFEYKSLLPASITSLTVVKSRSRPLR